MNHQKYNIFLVGVRKAGNQVLYIYIAQCCTQSKMV